MKLRKILLAAWLCATSFMAATTAHAGVNVHVPLPPLPGVNVPAPPLPSISVDVRTERPRRHYAPPPPPPRVYHRRYDRDPYYERDRHYRRDRHYDDDRRYHHRH